jgi:hypothetical protein
MPGGVVVGMFDVGLCEVPGSIPAGGIYFSTPIWHHFPMPDSTVSFWLICLISLSILHKFKKMIKITLRSKKIKKILVKFLMGMVCSRVDLPTTRTLTRHTRNP